MQYVLIRTISWPIISRSVYMGSSASIAVCMHLFMDAPELVVVPDVVIESGSEYSSICL